jgi:hypothetical protein
MSAAGLAKDTVARITFAAGSVIVTVHFQPGAAPTRQSLQQHLSRQENAYLLRYFVLKMIILPRQARDKHT